MAFLSWIQLASQLVENTAWPLDKKMQLSDSDRLSLSQTQRWLWMIVFSTTQWKWKILKSDYWNIDTDEWEWEDFTFSSSGWSINIWRKIINVTAPLEASKDYEITDTFVYQSECILLNWIELTYWYDYELSSNHVLFADNVVFEWDILVIKYILW